MKVMTAINAYLELRFASKFHRSYITFMKVVRSKNSLARKWEKYAKQILSYIMKKSELSVYDKGQ